MFERFSKKLLADNQVTPPLIAPMKNGALSEFLGRYAGMSFDRGLYRVMNAKMVAEANGFISVGFPEYLGKVCPFAFDWQGNIFAVNHQDLSAQVHMFEPGSGECMVAPYAMEAFHEDAVAEQPTNSLAAGYFSKWLQSGGEAPQYEQCIGYKTPRFLGGKDDLSNLVLIDISVEWHLNAQLIAKTRKLSPGTKATL
jgi:hypothetical protein